MVISHLHADHFLDLVPYSYALTYAPRQQPVPVHRWPGTDNPARPVLYAPPGARDTFRRVVGAWGNEDLIENAFDLRSTTPPRSSTSGRSGSPSRRCRTSPRRSRCASRRPPAAAGSSTAPTAARPTSSSSSRRTATLLIVEATLPRPERDGDARPPHPGGGRRARPRRRRARGSCSRTSRTSSIPSGRASRPAATFGGPVEVAARGRRLRGLSRHGLGARVLFSVTWPARATCSRTSSACGGRSTSSSATSSSARPACAAAGFSPAVDVYYADDPPRAVVKAELAGIDIEDVGLEIRGRQLLIAGERRPAEAAGPPLPADRDRARPVPPRRGAGRRRGGRAGARQLRGRDPEVEIPLARRERGPRRVPIEEGERRVSIHIPSADGEAAQADGRARACPRRCRCCRCATPSRSRRRSRRWRSGRSARSSSSTTCSAATACS